MRRPAGLSSFYGSTFSLLVRIVFIFIDDGIDMPVYDGPGSCGGIGSISRNSEQAEHPAHVIGKSATGDHGGLSGTDFCKCCFGHGFSDLEGSDSFFFGPSHEAIFKIIPVIDDFSNCSAAGCNQQGPYPPLDLLFFLRADFPEAIWLQFGVHMPLIYMRPTLFMGAFRHPPVNGSCGRLRFIGQASGKYFLSLGFAVNNIPYAH